MDQAFPYQIEGKDFLASKNHALLADEMGLGKTLQVILAADKINARNILVICPAIARPIWIREFQRWGGIKREFNVLEKLKDIPAERAVNICSFSYAGDSTSKLLAIKWDLIVVDEAHNLKNHKAKRTRAIMGGKGLLSVTKRMWLLTGTPAPNHAGELWVFLYTFGATRLKYNDFIKTYCTWYDSSYGLRITGTNMKKVPELREMLSRIMMRRLKAHVMSQLPKIYYEYITVEPGDVELDMMASFSEWFIPFDKSDKLMTKIEQQNQLLEDTFLNADIKVTAQLQVLNALGTSLSALRRFVGLQKLDNTVQYIHNCFINKIHEKLVIFAIHSDVIEELKRRLVKYHPVHIYGKTGPKGREKALRRFWNSRKHKIIILNIHAAGTAIDLTVAHDVLFVEQSWVPADNAQAVMRCHRIGQKADRVRVKYVTLYNTIDERITFLLKKKTKELLEIFD